MTSQKDLKWYQPSENFNWSITFKKFLYGLGNTLLIAGIAYTINWLQITDFPVEYAAYVGLATSILQALENLIKHWHD